MLFGSGLKLKATLLDTAPTVSGGPVDIKPSSMLTGRNFMARRYLVEDRR